VLRKISDYLKGWHLIIIGILFVLFGIYSFLCIKNSEAYSIRSILVGIMFLFGGIGWYFVSKK
jgi:uncharacterized membrane protein HdeD (DUF308 family)